MRSLLVLVATLATTCVLFGADRTECYVDQFGVQRCRVVKDVASNTTAMNVLLSGCGCGNPDCTSAACDCASGSSARSGATVTTAYTSSESYALDTSARAVLFPRVRSFVSTLSHNRQLRLARAFHAGFFARFRR